MFEMGPSLLSSPAAALPDPARSMGAPAHGRPGGSGAGLAVRAVPRAAGRAVQPQAASPSLRPPARSRARKLYTLTCLKLFINSPGGARLRLRLWLRPRLLRPGGLAPPCGGAHAKQINMPWLTHASQPADRVSAAPCGN